MQRGRVDDQFYSKVVSVLTKSEGTIQKNTDPLLPFFTTKKTDNLLHSDLRKCLIG